LTVSKRKADALDFNFGFNRKPRRRPTGKRSAAQKAAYSRYFGGGKKK
jgi:hypothetical protein